MAAEAAEGVTARVRGKSRRRLAQEWLLLPVFALPVLLAAGALLFAEASHARLLDRCGRDGASAAARWLAADPRSAAWTVSRFDESIARAAAEPKDWVPFRRGGIEGLVRAPGASAGDAPWVVSPGYLAGLRPSALADPAVRLAVESGTPIARSSGADDGTAAFAEILAAPTRERFLGAALPAAAKLYLAHRLAGDARAVVADGDAAVLRALRDLDDALEAPSLVVGGDPPHVADAANVLRPGCCVAGETRILVPTSGAPVLLVPVAEEIAASAPLAVLDDPDGVALLYWVPSRAMLAGDVLWRGPLDEPLAGEWAIVAPEGRTWWGSGAGAVWAVPLAGVCLAFLAVPAALLVAMRRRRRLDEARSRFVNEIAHDLRTPVAALRLHADLLASGRVPEGDRVKHTEILGREAARLTALLSNLLDLSRVERGSRPFGREPVDASEIVRDGVREFGTLHPRRGADVGVECPDALPIVADRTALARALANLLDNAGKFTPEGTPVRVRAEPTEDGGARIRVEDEGPGIPAEERTRVFLPYERGSAAAKTAAPGTGLGLSLVRELVEGMGGAVALVDSPRGAAFEIRLPGGTR